MDGLKHHNHASSTSVSRVKILRCPSSHTTGRSDSCSAPNMISELFCNLQRQRLHLAYMCMRRLHMVTKKCTNVLPRSCAEGLVLGSILFCVPDANVVEVRVAFQCAHCDRVHTLADVHNRPIGPPAGDLRFRHMVTCAHQPQATG